MLTAQQKSSKSPAFTFAEDTDNVLQDKHNSSLQVKCEKL